MKVQMILCMHIIPGSVNLNKISSINVSDACFRSLCCIFCNRT